MVLKKLPKIFIIVSIIIVLLVWNQLRNSESGTVTNFKECIAAGNPAMESYPRQCIHDDQHFVEDIDPIDIPTSADNAPPGSMHNLPVPDAVSAVRTHLASELGVSEGVVIVMSAYKKDWSDSCIGLPENNELCATVITPGYEVTVQAQGNQYIYHTNGNGSVLRRK